MRTRRAGQPAPTFLWRLLALLAALAMVATACGGGGDDDGGTAGGGQTEPVDEGEPVAGGTLVYGLEAATAGGLRPGTCICDISGHQRMKAPYDTLTIFNEDGDVVPNLAESFEANDDFTEWTFTVRPGITFHDGTPLDGAAVAANFNMDDVGLLKSFLTKSALLPIAEVTADGQTVTFRMEHPWPSFPDNLTGQLGYVASPTWLEATRAGAASADKPVGTGPFVYQSGDPTTSMTFARNEGYWREGLPYLDAVEFRTIIESDSRVSALEDGQINAFHTSNSDAIARMRGREDLELREITENQETNYILLNSLPEIAFSPDSPPQPNPLSDPRVRRALAHATDYDFLIESRGAGIVEQANGPFPPGQIGHVDDTGFPDFDLDEAKRLVAEWEQENGPLRVTYTTTDSAFNRTTAELIQQMWSKAGIDVEIGQVEQSSFIIQALGGRFQAFGWRNHGRMDPDLEWVWWASETAQPLGESALNFGRIDDPEVDKHLTTIRQSADEEERVKAAEALNRRFGDQVFNIWTSWTLWAITSQPRVNGLTSFTAPNGDPVPVGMGIGGSHYLTEAWIQQ